ncbi:MAG TPA: MarR family transcriptional regulator [Methylocella sp.]|nr:MarR family transcriptional regulator [Methylocella sp.]
MGAGAIKPRLEQQLCFAIYSTMHVLTKAYQPLLEKLGLTYPQYLAMLVLWEGGDITVKDVGERLFLDSGTLTPLLKRLESMGLVHRARDARDERRVRLTLSEKGRALRMDAEPLPREIAALTGRSPEDLKAVRKELRKIRNALIDARAPKAPGPDGRVPLAWPHASAEA